MGPVF
jgi:hypothetical protein